jgi:hypothetical protein
VGGDDVGVRGRRVPVGGEGGSHGGVSLMF